MPRGDGTGPNGMGAMTGRRMGFCAGFSLPGFSNRGGFGGMGAGRGRGWLQAWPAQQAVPTPEAERNYLNSRADSLQAELDSIRKRLSAIENGETS